MTDMRKKRTAVDFSAAAVGVICQVNAQNADNALQQVLKGLPLTFSLSARTARSSKVKRHVLHRAK